MHILLSPLFHGLKDAILKAAVLQHHIDMSMNLYHSLTACLGKYNRNQNSAEEGERLASSPCRTHIIYPTHL
jgi:hypothetical protein